MTPASLTSNNASSPNLHPNRGELLSSIFALKFGEDALVGITNGGIQVEDLGSLETKDARRHRIKWYVNGVVLFSTLAAAAIDGISSAAVVA